MRAPLGWLRDWVALPAETTGRELAEKLISAGLEVETVEAAGADVTGPLVLGRVLGYEVEQHSNGKSIRWCRVDVGPRQRSNGTMRAASAASSAARTTSRSGTSSSSRCPERGAARRFEIAARKTYGHVSDGMICSATRAGAG